MKESLKFSNPRWLVMTMAKPVLWPRCDQETWSLTPPNRYVVNAEYSSRFSEDQVEEVSDLKGSAYHKPFVGLINLNNSKILVERHRSRGIGDLLFLSGPLSYLHHMSGGTVKFFLKSLVDRGSVLYNHPALHLKTPLYGPTVYDTLPLYDYHWFIESVTEFNEDREQPNVYDVLYRQIGFDPKTIDPVYKRPSVGFDESDTRGLHAFYHAIWSEKQIDLRSEPYYVVAPFSHGVVRSAPYGLWLNLIHELSQNHPVLIIGSLRHELPDMDMPAGEFVQRLRMMSQQQAKIINLISDLPLRSVLTIISKSKCVFCLDSAPLYMAQACRVPAISVWGPHSPRVRIGYDKAYMDLAIHAKEACPNSPCFAYSGFPERKCPEQEAQKFCAVLANVGVNDIMEKLSLLEQ
jgi:hypothetical protein